MSLTYKPISSLPPPKVFIDTTVLCGAIRKPGGINEKILGLARANILFTPVFSKVCLLEFQRNALNGLGNILYTPDEVESYITGMIRPILDENPPVNSVVGRYSIETILRENRPLKEVLQLLSGYTLQEVDDIAAAQELSEPLHRFDQDDFHVWVTAIQMECDYIVTANTKRFPNRIGYIKRMHPRDFYAMLTGE
ncbi:PIN domain-containing protein [Sporosarcina highlanderae]|uniref:PIN domain-containing protein n=1 Tax=Sporosarcina highlanderae TaxID=3035916 RepID=A0ABT8JSM2_9BACL|nr:PIN domain-containing protein [Sporosarcina highlanderae]MDN4608151.1 PIN domain-containing protein [Sporosarcina highlanderae]